MTTILSEAPDRTSATAIRAAEMVFLEVQERGSSERRRAGEARGSSCGENVDQSAASLKPKTAGLLLYSPFSARQEHLCCPLTMPFSLGARRSL
jgi:hypothetical protein